MTKKIKNKPSKAGGNSRNVAAEAIGARNEFYRDSSKKIMIGMAAGVFSLVSSIGLTFYSSSLKYNNEYFVTDENGSFIKLVPLSAPNQKDTVVSSWVQEAVIDTFDFHYQNANKRIGEATSLWYTDGGRESLLRAFEKNNIIEDVQQNGVIVTAALNHTPIIIQRTDPGADVFKWKLQAEGIITYRTRTRQVSNKVVFDIEVSRRSLLIDKKGLGISRIVMDVKL